MEEECQIELGKVKLEESSINLDKTADTKDQEESKPDGIQESEATNDSLEEVEEELTLACEIGDKNFKKPGYLRRHIDVVHNKPKPKLPHVCQICDKTFKVPSLLKYHIKAIHEGIKSHKCSKCSSCYKSRQGLQNHFNLVHLKLKPHKCFICEKSFGRKGHLKRHHKWFILT